MGNGVSASVLHRGCRIRGIDAAFAEGVDLASLTRVGQIVTFSAELNVLCHCYFFPLMIKVIYVDYRTKNLKKQGKNNLPVITPLLKGI